MEAISVLFALGILYVIYGAIASSIGFYAILHPCNCEAVATIITCTAGSEFGQVFANITYIDYLGIEYNGTIVASNGGACEPGQHLNLCYPMLNSSDFRDDKVFLHNPYAKKALLITGLPGGIVAAIMLCICVLTSKNNHYPIIIYDGISSSSPGWSRV